MGLYLTSVEVAREHGLDEEQTKELQQLVLKHCSKCSAAILPDWVDGTDYQEQLERLTKAASKPVLEAFEDYLRRDLSEVEARATV